MITVFQNLSTLKTNIKLNICRNPLNGGFFCYVIAAIGGTTKQSRSQYMNACIR